MTPLRLALAALLVATPSFAAPSAPASATPGIWYVDCSKGPVGTGSAAAPWRSLTQVATHGDFHPADRILLRRGTTCTGRLTAAGDGTAGAPITIGAYGRGLKPLIRGGGTPEYTGAVSLTDQQYWTVQDLRVTNSDGHTSTQTYRSGVSVRNHGAGTLSGIIIRRVDVSDVASAPNELQGNSREWGGITAAADGGGTFAGLTIEDNTVDEAGRSGIMIGNWAADGVFNTNVRITGNRITRVRGDGILLQGARDSRIDHNVVQHAADEWPCPLCGALSPRTANAGIWPARSRNVLVDHNEVSGLAEKGGDGEAFDSDQGTYGVVFEYNYAHDNQGGGMFFCGSHDAVARFNVLQNNGRAAFNFIGNVPAYGTEIYNNTVYTKKLPKTKALRTFNGFSDSDVSFFNNIVLNYSSGEWQWPSSHISTRANTLIGVNSTGRPHDEMTSFKNPGLKKPGSGRIGFASLKGYEPRSHAAVQHGVKIPVDVTRDFFGRSINPAYPPRGAAG